MNVVDSCAWLEYFADGPNAEFFAGAIEEQDDLLVPVISLFDVFRRVSQQRGEGAALRATAVMLLLAAARSAGATLWTQDADFAEIPGVEYVPRAG